MAVTIRAIATPVVFTNNNGGGADEYQAPANAPATVQLHAGGGQVVAAWYAGLDNLSDLPKIHYINCEPGGDHVNLVIKGLPGNADARVRIRIYAAVNA